MVAIAQRIAAPVMANMVYGGRTPLMSAERLREIGFAAAIFPAAGFLASAAALEAAYSDLRENGCSTGRAAMYSFEAFNRMIGFPEVWEFEKRYVVLD